MSGGSKKVYNLLVVNDLWFQHPLLEERQQNLRVFTVEIYRREKSRKKDAGKILCKSNERDRELDQIRY